MASTTTPQGAVVTPLSLARSAATVHRLYPGADNDDHNDGIGNHAKNMTPRPGQARGSPYAPARAAGACRGPYAAAAASTA
jgi:hypothetical protein